jgi:hypothetical protein
MILLARLSRGEENARLLLPPGAPAMNGQAALITAITVSPSRWTITSPSF